VLASTKEEDSAEEKKEEYLNRKQKQRLLRDATTLREEDAHAALLIRSRNSKQLFIFVQPTVSRFSPEISFKMSHKKGTNSREIQAHHSFLLLRRFCARFFLSLFLLVLIFRFVSSFCEK
jgi:magnesium-transporting ATPase (P-type)